MQYTKHTLLFIYFNIFKEPPFIYYKLWIAEIYVIVIYTSGRFFFNVDCILISKLNLLIESFPDDLSQRYRIDINRQNKVTSGAGEEEEEGPLHIQPRRGELRIYPWKLN